METGKSFSPIIQNYTVDFVSSEIVAPALPMQQRSLPLSNLDLTIPPVCFHVFFCYNKPSQRYFASLISHLKNSLSRALVPFYVLSGRLVANDGGELELLCNNKGVQFSQAYVAIALAELSFYNPDATVQGKLVPLLPQSSQGHGTHVFAVQVTEFRCGGIVVGCTLDHRIADASSANMFFKYWANLSRNGSTESLNPSLNKSILSPKDPLNYCSAIDKMYLKQSLMSSGESRQETLHPPLESRIYYVNAKDIENLQMSASECGHKYTKLEAFCAYLWKLLMESREIKNTLNCKMGIVVDGRSRLTNMGMTANYFGNVLLLPFAEACAGDIKNQPLSWTAKLILDVIYTAANEEYFQSLIDLVEAIRPTPVLASIYRKRNDKLSDAPAVLVSSGLRFPLYEIDHGWGKPRFASYHFPWGGNAGYVMPTLRPQGDGSWIVYMHLAISQLNAIESHSSCIFHPFT